MTLLTLILLTNLLEFSVNMVIAETELPISEIAFLCGFGGISQFNRSFRADTGTTPRDYRKNS